MTYLRAGVLLEDLGLTWSNEIIDIFNPVGLYIVPEVAFRDKIAAVTEWYEDKTIKDIQMLFLNKVDRLPASYQARFPDKFYIYNHTNGEVEFCDNTNLVLLDGSIANLLIPWMR